MKSLYKILNNFLISPKKSKSHKIKKSNGTSHFQNEITNLKGQIGLLREDIEYKDKKNRQLNKITKKFIKIVSSNWPIDIFSFENFDDKCDYEIYIYLKNILIRYKDLVESLNSNIDLEELFSSDIGIITYEIIHNHQTLSNELKQQYLIKVTDFINSSSTFIKVESYGLDSYYNEEQHYTNNQQFNFGQSVKICSFLIKDKQDNSIIKKVLVKS